MNIPLIKFKKGAVSKDSSNKKAKNINRTIRDWFPIEDINNSIMYRKDGYLVSALRIEPVNTSLMSKSEEISRIELLGEVLSGIDIDYQFLFLPKPIDMDKFINYLEDLKKQETDDLFRLILNDEIQNATEKQISGEIMERLYYMLIAQPAGKNIRQSELEIISRIKDIVNLLYAARLEASICKDDELRNIQFLFFNQKHAAIERAPERDYLYPPIYEKGV